MRTWVLSGIWVISLLHSPTNASETDLNEIKGGAPAYVGLELGAAFPTTLGRYLLFGLEGQPGIFDIYRVGELEGNTNVEFEALFNDSMQSGTLTVSGTNGSARGLFEPPTLDNKDMNEGELSFLSASAPAMLLEPLSVDYVFLSRSFVLGQGNRTESRTDQKIAVSATLCEFVYVIFCNFFDGCKTVRSSGKALLPNGDLISSRFHSEIVMRSESGRYYDSRYQQHALEFVEGLFATPIFLYDVNAAISAWSPAFQSALDGDGSYPVDQRMEDTISIVVQGYLDSSGPALRTMIEQESQRMELHNLAGLTINQIIQRIEGSYTDSLFQDAFEVL